jgi:hypothetical protein
MSGPVNRPGPGGPYETEQQTRADVACVYEQSRRSTLRDALAEANYAYLINACERAGVELGRYDARILTWLANWEPETCAVVAGLICRSHAVGPVSTATRGANDSGENETPSTSSQLS